MTKTLPPEASESVKKVLMLLAQSSGPRLHELEPAQARQMFDMLTPSLDMPVAEVERVEQLTVEGGDGFIGAEAYWPKGAAATGLPLILFFHGGGFVIGSPKTHARLCRYLANAAGALVVSVDYRLAPEQPFPAAVEDAFAATRWAAAEAGRLGADPAKLFVAGDSAGGNLAAVVCLMARETGGPAIAGQILLYPATDMANLHPSRERYAEGFFLEKQGMDWFAEAYVPDPAQRSDWRVSPLLAADHRGLPPALVVTASLDPLVDEGEAYAQKLKAAGNEVADRCYRGLIHGFLCMGGMIPEARAGLDQVAEWVKARL